MTGSRRRLWSETGSSSVGDLREDGARPELVERDSGGVAAGLGVSIMPSLGVGPAAFPTHACAIAAPTPTRRISIALARDGCRPPSVGTMIEILKDAAVRRTAVA